MAMRGCGTGFVVALALLVMPLTANAAQQPCKLYKPNAPILDVFKNPGIVGQYVGVLEKAETACVRKVKKIGKRDWGFVSHKIVKSGAPKPMNGWVGLRFLSPVSIPKSATATTATTTIATSATRQLQPAGYDKQAELAFWDTVKTTRDPELLRAYLQKYPTGTFASLATIILRKHGKSEGNTTKTAVSTSSSSRSQGAGASQSRSITRSQDRDRRTSAKKERARKARRERSRRDRRAEKRASATRTIRKRRKRCRLRLETKWECMRRGGATDREGACPREMRRFCK